MPGVRLSLGNQAAPPVIPFPHKTRIFGEGLRSGQVLGLVLLPESVRAAESGDTALGGDACSGERYHGRCGLEPLASGIHDRYHDSYSVARSAAAPFARGGIMG